MSNRTEVMEWWYSMDLENKFYKTIECNHLLVGDTVDNHPDRLTGREIEIIYKYFNNDQTNRRSS